MNAESRPRLLERRHWRRLERPGLTPRQERVFNTFSIVLVMVFAAGWTYTLAGDRTRGVSPSALTSTVTASPLSSSAPPATPYLLDAAIRSLMSDASLSGYSGAVRVAVQAAEDTLALPDSLARAVRIEYGSRGSAGGAAAAPSAPGVWNVLVRMGEAVRPVPNFAVLKLVPLSEKKAGRIGSYLIGSWPNERGRPSSPAYAPPRGLVRVTPENMNTPVSEHFRLRDFLTKGQENVWPKYVALSPRLLDKLELTIQELERGGYEVRDVGVISGFRTPQYNAHGGETGGRGKLSRHMYGDAMDIYVDNDGDGRMDDLNRDGRVDFGDARTLAAAADRVERKYPSLIGGIGTYRATGAHAGFVHLDTRGFRARW